MSLVTVSNGHAMTSPAKTEGGADVLSEAVQEITKTENKPLAMVSAVKLVLSPPSTVETGYKVYVCPRGNLLYCRPYFISNLIISVNISFLLTPPE